MASEIISSIITGGATVIAAVIIAISTLRGIKSIGPQKGIEIRKINDFIREINALLLKSQKEVIIIGGTMSQLGASQDIINKLERRDIKIKLLAVDITQDDIRQKYLEMIDHRRDHIKDLDYLKPFENKENITIKVYKTLPTAYFIAIDLHDNKNGFIKVVHILPGRSENDYPHIEIKRSNIEFYEFYRQYIDDLWEKGSSWNSC